MRTIYNFHGGENAEEAKRYIFSRRLKIYKITKLIKLYIANGFISINITQVE